MDCLTTVIYLDHQDHNIHKPIELRAGRQRSADMCGATGLRVKAVGCSDEEDVVGAGTARKRGRAVSERVVYRRVDVLCLA